MHTAGLMQCKDGDYPGTVRSRVVIVLLLYAVNGDNVEFRVFLASLEYSDPSVWLTDTAAILKAADGK